MAQFVNSDRLVAFDSLAAANLRQNVSLLVLQFRWNQPRNRLTDHLLRCVPEQPFGALVPGGDDALERLAHDPVFGRIDYGRQVGARPLELNQILSPRFTGAGPWTGCLLHGAEVPLACLVNHLDSEPPLTAILANSSGNTFVEFEP